MKSFIKISKIALTLICPFVWYFTFDADNMYRTDYFFSVTLISLICIYLLDAVDTYLLRQSVVIKEAAVHRDRAEETEELLSEEREAEKIELARRKLFREHSKRK